MPGAGKAEHQWYDTLDRLRHYTFNILALPEDPIESESATLLQRVPGAYKLQHLASLVIDIRELNNDKSRQICNSPYSITNLSITSNEPIIRNPFIRTLPEAIAYCDRSRCQRRRLSEPCVPTITYITIMSSHVCGTLSTAYNTTFAKMQPWYRRYHHLLVLRPRGNPAVVAMVARGVQAAHPRLPSRAHDHPRPRHRHHPRRSSSSSPNTSNSPARRSFTRPNTTWPRAA